MLHFCNKGCNILITSLGVNIKIKKEECSIEISLKKFTKEILKDLFKGNQRQCSLKLGVSPEQLNKILKRKIKSSSVFLGKLKKFCDENNLNFNDFIILK